MTSAGFNIKIPEPERIKLYFLNFREQIKVAKTLLRNTDLISFLRYYIKKNLERKIVTIRKSEKT